MINFTSRIEKWQLYIPWCLVWLRVALAPVAIYLVYYDYSRWLWLFQFAIAVLSDWYDGKLARRWGVVSPGLRQADSLADIIYAMAIVWSFWLAHQAVVLDHLWGIGLVVGLEAARYPLDWVLFKRGASYHAISACVFGASLIVATIGIMGFDSVGPFLWVSLGLGVISELEGIAISMVLPKWTHDVAHLGIALQIRRDACLSNEDHRPKDQA